MITKVSAVELILDERKIRNKWVCRKVMKYKIRDHNEEK